MQPGRDIRAHVERHIRRLRSSDIGAGAGGLRAALRSAANRRSTPTPLPRKR